MADRRTKAVQRLDASEYEVLAGFRHTLRRFLSFSETAAAEVGLAPQQYQALLAIKGRPGRDMVTINELAQLLLIKHNSAVGLVDRLEAEGLVRRSTAPEDRRKVNLRLTAKGKRIFERLAVAHRDELRRIGPHLGEFLQYFSQPRGREGVPPARLIALVESSCRFANDGVQSTAGGERQRRFTRARARLPR